MSRRWAPLLLVVTAMLRIDARAATATGRPVYDAVDAIVAQHRYADAEALARDLLSRCVARSCGPLEEADALDALAWALFRAGRSASPETRTVAERAVRLKEESLARESLEAAFSLNSLDRILVARGELEEARAVAQRVISIREKLLGPDDIEVGRALNNLALVEGRLGESVAARRRYERVLEIFAKAGAPEHPDRAVVLTNLGVVLKSLGAIPEAITLFERVVSIQQKALGPGAGELGGSLGNLCNALTLAGNLARARETCERSLSIWLQDPGPDTLEEAGALSNLANVLFETGELERSRTMIERAIRIRQDRGQASYSVTSGCLRLLGRILLREGNPEGARSRLQDALRIKEATLPPGHPDIAGDLRDLGEVQLRMGETGAAWDSARRAAGIARGNVREMSGGLSEREAVQLAATHAAALDLLVSLAAGGAGDPPSVDKRRRALDEVIRSRAMVLDEMAARHTAVAGAGGGEVARLREALSEARARFSRLLVADAGKGAGRGDGRLLDGAREAMERAERALADASAGDRQRLAVRDSGLAEVAAALPAGGALVSYSRYRRLDVRRDGEPIPSYLALVLPASGEPALVTLGDAAPIDAMVSRWRAEAGTPPAPSSGSRDLARYERAGAALRRAVWDPVAASLGSRRIVFVVPDGTLSLVSFAALPDGAGRYLVETGPLIHYLSAERDLAREGRPARGRGRLLALGGPDFDRGASGGSRPGHVASARSSSPAAPRGPRDLCPDFGSHPFQPLGGSLAEVRELESIWSGKGEAVVLTGVRADEASVKQEAAGFDVLHFATHAFSLELPCGGKPGGATARDHPLLLSGLALAGANHPDRALGGDDGEDGLLTSDEIASLDLTGVDWVVLSACETGIGAVLDGEGVFGLRRAFEVAGAGTLILSLWPVEDAATRVWMRGLYDARLAGRSTIEAVHDAAAGMLEAQRRRGATTHPYYWGAFLAAGDWR